MSSTPRTPRVEGSNPPPTSSASSALAGASAAASYNAALQIGVRAVTFLLNAFTLRFVTKETLGVVNVRLALLYTTILVLSQEPFRRASLSLSSDPRHWRRVVRLFWTATAPLTLLLSAALVGVWTTALTAPEIEERLEAAPLVRLLSSYSASVVVFAVAAVVEVSSSSLLVASQAFFVSRLKVAAESLAILFKSSLTVFLLTTRPHWGLLIFSSSQLLFALVKSLTFLLYFLFAPPSSLPSGFPFRRPRDLFPSADDDAPDDASDRLGDLSWSIAKQTVVKQLLTEGERYVMTIFDVLSFADQGIFDVVNNLGSLVVRFCFQPIEEAGFLFFSRTLRREERTTTTTTTSEEQTEEPPATLASRVFFHLLRLVTHLGLLVVVFGQSYSHAALHLFGGAALSDGAGPSLLRCYCLYVLTVAWNGTLECYATAVMRRDEVDSYTKRMVGFSFVFLAASMILTKWQGALGFVLANCVNMLLRVAFCARFALGHAHKFRRRVDGLETHPLWGLALSPATLACYVAAFAVTWASEARIYEEGVAATLLVAHVAVGGGALVATIGFAATRERETIRFAMDEWKRRRE